MGSETLSDSCFWQQELRTEQKSHPEDREGVCLGHNAPNQDQGVPTANKNLFQIQRLDHCGSLAQTQTMEVSLHNLSVLTFEEIPELLKDKSSSMFFLMLTAKGGCEGRETSSPL